MAAKIMRKSLNWYAGLWPRVIPRPPYQHIVQVGDPILRLKCENVPLESIKTEETKKVISSLKDVMAAYECVGLAAPQIGISKRIFVMEMNDKRLKEFDLHMIEKCQMFAFPLMVFINPTMKVIDTTKVSHIEACESIKGFCAEVPRYQEVQINGYNEEGSLVSIKFGGWPSRIAQHEMDHLDGQNYVDIMNKDTFACHLWREVNLHAGKIKLPFSAC